MKKAICWILKLVWFRTKQVRAWLSFKKLSNIHISIYVYILIYYIAYIYIYIYIYIYGIHHWRIFRSSYRKLAWVGFEPPTTEFRSDALTDWIDLQKKYCKNFNGLYHLYQNVDFCKTNIYIRNRLWCSLTLKQTVATSQEMKFSIKYFFCKCAFSEEILNEKLQFLWNELTNLTSS